MKRGGKFFIYAVFVVLLLVAGGAWYLSSNLDQIVTRLIEEKGSEATGTEVRVGNLSLALREGTGTINRLRVANPADFSNAAAIAFEDFRIRMDPLAVTSEPIVIQEVSVSGASILLEQTTAGNNLQRLLSALQGDPRPVEQPQDAGPEIIIERFTLAESSVSLDVPQLQERREIDRPRIVINDIGRASNGATAAEAARQILAPIIRKTLESSAVRNVQDIVREKIGTKKDEVTRGLLNRLTGSDEDDSAGDSRQ